MSLMKHLTTHGINLRAERCSVFDSKKNEPQSCWGKKVSFFVSGFMFSRNKDGVGMVYV